MSHLFPCVGEVTKGHAGYEVGSRTLVRSLLLDVVRLVKRYVDSRVARAGKERYPALVRRAFSRPRPTRRVNWRGDVRPAGGVAASQRLRSSDPADVAAKSVSWNSYQFTLTFDSSLLLNKLRVEGELRCNYAEEKHPAPPEIDDFGEEKDYLLLHRNRAKGNCSCCSCPRC